MSQIIPAEVQGFFRRHRTWTQLGLIAFFLILPWTKVGGFQSLLIDFKNYQLAFFGVLYQAHEAPLIFLVLASIVLALALVTSLFGRVWCGWACPQTVFIDGVYRRIERWTEGNYIARRRLKEGPLTAEKALRVGAKWILFFVASSLIAHSFIAYFVGSHELLAMMAKPPGENWTYFLLISGMTLVLLFDFGIFREQFCIYACPYGRFQSVLIDNNTTTVVYDTARGEPRKAPHDDPTKRGDCVSCNRCVQVCPTGIDIRNGLQLECIGCTACIDACNEIMEKVHKPKNLISYRTLDGTKFRFFKLKAVFYSLALLLSISTLGYSMVTRTDLDVSALRAEGLPYTTLDGPDGMLVTNHFKLHVTNQTNTTKTYKIDVFAEQKPLKVTMAVNPVVLPGLKSATWHVFIQTLRSDFHSSTNIPVVLTVTDTTSNQVIQQKNLTLLGPVSQ